MLLIKETSRYRFLVVVAALAAASIAVSGCASITPPPATPISTIINAAASGKSSESIIANIRAGKTTYALRGSDFPKLAERGVPGPVLDELQQRFFGDVEFLTKRWYMGRSAGGPSSIYPQPVDLDNLDAGGDGMAPTTGVGRATHGSRPPGVPDWVPPFPAVSGQPISPEDVLEMTRSGQPTGQIVETVQTSRVAVLYAGSRNAVSQRRTAAITGTTYADMAKQGVAPEVLDALQATYLADHVEITRKSTPVGAGGGNQK